MDITITTETLLINTIKENVLELVIITVKFIKKFVHTVWKEMAKVNINHKENVHGKQSLMIIISSFFHHAFRCVNTIQKVRGTVSGSVQLQRGRRDNTILHRQKQLLSFQNEHFLYF